MLGCCTPELLIEQGYAPTAMQDIGRLASLCSTFIFTFGNRIPC